MYSMIIQVVWEMGAAAAAVVFSEEWFEECSHPSLSQTPPLLPPCECYGTKRSTRVLLAYLSSTVGSCKSDRIVTTVNLELVIHVMRPSYHHLGRLTGTMMTVRKTSDSN